MRVAVTISVAGMAARRGTSGGARSRRAGFTLVELLVTMVIVAILAALTLAGLAGVRQGAKADKTRNTIRKIDAVIRPMYDSYRNRRVLDLPTQPDRFSASVQILEAKRRLIAYEMPDRWEDVPLPAEAGRIASGPKAVPPGMRSAAVRSYAAARPALPNTLYGGAECLYLIVQRSGYDPDALEFFRSDEIGDLDQDGMSEFLDGWGRPISFLRWAPGFVSPIQIHDSTNAHDPLDPKRIDDTAYALVPLIYSSGPDGATAAPADDQTGFGLADFSRLDPSKKAWTDPSRSMLQMLGSALNQSGELVGTPASDEALDNITNHDLLKK
jgi:prepilin-type N-terminal cleavage/methylation domain-containing protein